MPDQLKERALYPLLDLVKIDDFSLVDFIPEGLVNDLVSRLYQAESKCYFDGENVNIEFLLIYEQEIALYLPGFSDFALIIASAGTGWSSLRSELAIGPEAYFTLFDARAALRLPKALLRDKASGVSSEIVIQGDLEFSEHGIRFERFRGATLAPAYLLDTGIIVAAEDIRPVFNIEELEKGLDIHGIAFDLLSVTIPPELFTLDMETDLTFQAKEAMIDQNGFSGKLNVKAEDLEFSINGLFQTLPFRFREFQMEIFRNTFIKLSLGADLRLKFLENDSHENRMVFDFHLGKESAAVEARVETPLLFVFGADNRKLEIENLELSGARSEKGFNLQGTASGKLFLPQFQVDLDQVVVSYSHLQSGDRFSFELTDLTLGPLGKVDRGIFRLETKKDENGESQLDLFHIETEIAWQDLSSRLHLSDLPDFFPLPPDTAKVAAVLSWKESGEMLLGFSTEAENPDQLWRFVPDKYAPEVPEASFIFEALYNDLDQFQNADPGAPIKDDDNLKISILSEMAVKLPELPVIPGFELIKIDSGDDTGLIRARLSATFQTIDENNLSFEMGLENPFFISLNMPGTEPQFPFVQCALNNVGLQFEAKKDENDEQAVGGKMFFEGDFEFQPQVPLKLPFAEHFNSLMQQVGLDRIKGSSLVKLEFTEDSFDMELQGEFDNFGINLDIFKLLGSVSPAAGGESDNEIEIDFDIGFHLIGFSFKIGTAGNSGSENDYYFSFKLNVECTMTGLPPTIASITLSDKEFSFGIEDLSIPITIPKYPIDMEDLNRLVHDDGIWSLKNGTPGKAYLVGLQEQGNLIENQIKAASTSEIEKFRLRKNLAFLEIKSLMLELMMVIHQSVSVAGNDSAIVYQELVTADTWIHSTVMNFLHFDTNLILFFPEIKFKIPFDNPSGIAVSGSGKLTGFAEDDPFKALEDYTFSLGLSSQYIFAKIESTGAPVPIPHFGTKYDDGSISISKFMIGYGYTKNSFAFDFAGELIVPSGLIDDANTSDEIGFGVKIPRFNKLAFQLDMMVFTIGKATVAIPVPRFDLDLRSPDAPDFADIQRCIPYWDGLEVFIKNVIHADLKHFAFSPFFGFSVIPNLKYKGDLNLGDDKNGLTLIINDLLILFGTWGGGSFTVPIPFFASPDQPYFRNICCNLRLLGFEINFNLERPFPSFSPLALLEVFGLISNPMMKIDPHGSLSNTIRFTLSDAYLKAPDFLLTMFPEAANLVDKRYGFTLNLGTLIIMVQTIIGALSPVIENTKSFVEDSTQNLSDWMNSLPNNFDPWEIIGLLPPELRTIKLENGNIGGFNASACLVISTEAEAKASFHARNTPPSAGLEPLEMKAGSSFMTYEKFPEPAFIPTDGEDFNNDWHQEGADGNWEYENDTIFLNDSLNGISFFVYQKEISENMNMTFRHTIPSKIEDNDSGIVFSYADSDNFYVIKISSSLEGEQQIILNRKKSGTFLSDPLIKKAIRKKGPEVILELTAFRQGEEKLFIVNQIHKIYDRYSHPKQLRTFRTEIGRSVDKQPLGNGKIGLYAKNTSGVRFSHMLVYELKLSPKTFKEIKNPEFNVNLVESKFSDTRPIGKEESLSLFRGEEFELFDEDHLGLIPVAKLPHKGAGLGSIFMGTRLTILEDQDFRFFGKLFQDGSFALLSEAEVGPLNLSVFGIPVKIPFQGYGNLIAAGWPKSNGYEGFVEANGYFKWSPIPNVLQIEVGSRNKLSRLQLFSNGKFHFSSNALITLFDGAARIDGQADISNNLCEFRGRLKYQTGNIIELDIQGEGAIGNRPKYWFDGFGSVVLFGKKFSNVTMGIDDNRAMVSFFLNTESLPRFDFLDGSFRSALQLDGKINLKQQTRPEFEFTGEGSLSAFGAEIEGYGGVRSVVSTSQTGDYFEIFMGGRLSWQGREWLQGKIALHSKTGFHLEGHTFFGLTLTPGNIGGTDIAGLLFSLNLGGSVNMTPGGDFNFDMKLDWAIGINLPGNERQILPIAAGATNIRGNLGLPVNLINLNGFKLIPLDGFNFSLPIPRIKGKGDPVMLIGVKNKKIAINVPQLGTFYLDEHEFVTGLTGGILPSLNPGTFPNINPGSLPNLSSGTLPSLNSGKSPSLNINFSQMKFDFDPGALPSLNRGSLPSLNKGSLPSLYGGSLPILNRGEFPILPHLPYVPDHHQQGLLSFPVATLHPL
jgi:hypothetical protein